MVGCLTLARGLAAEGNSSLTESNIEQADARATAGMQLSSDELQRQLAVQRESVKTLTDSLAESNAEAELFRRKYSDLQLRMEALGLESASKDRSKLEQRLLSAVSDLKLAQKFGDRFVVDRQPGHRDRIRRFAEIDDPQGGQCGDHAVP